MTCLYIFDIFYNYFAWRWKLCFLKACVINLLQKMIFNTVACRIPALKCFQRIPALKWIKKREKKIISIDGKFWWFGHKFTSYNGLCGYNIHPLMIYTWNQAAKLSLERKTFKLNTSQYAEQFYSIKRIIHDVYNS